MTFPGKVAVVTGAGSGIGRATAIALAEQGARVAIVDRDEAAASETAHFIGDDAFAVRADTACESDVVEMVARVQQAFGRVDLLHNHAGILHPADASILDISEEAIDGTLSV